MIARSSLALAVALAGCGLFDAAFAPATVGDGELCDADVALAQQATSCGSAGLDALCRFDARDFTCFRDHRDPCSNAFNGWISCDLAKHACDEISAGSSFCDAQATALLDCIAGEGGCCHNGGPPDGNCARDDEGRATCADCAGQ